MEVVEAVPPKKEVPMNKSRKRNYRMKGGISR